MFSSLKGQTKQKNWYSRSEPQCNFLEHYRSDFLMKLIFSFCSLLCFVFLLAGCQKSQGPAQHVNVVMKKYTFEPSVIRVKAGQPVELDVTTADVQHGFDVPELGIKESVQPGRTTAINFTPTTKGEFGVKCGVICGPHHDDMAAKLVVD
jgi:heme/copper-type cytochrome/quinol oxidase subunit 2